MSSTSPAREQVSVRRVAFASAIGATIEWYDFFIYGTAAALVFNRLFFSNLPDSVGTLVAFGTFAVGFLARPVGAVIFGHLGDKVGRKKMLILTLAIMGVSTFVIGLLPTYDQVGVLAPILLVVMRVLQGIGVGGEYGGAVLMAVEYAPRGRRGFYGSWPQVGVPGGLLLASLMFSALSFIPDAQFDAWAWRIAFLSTIVLAAVGLYVRLKVMETPAFAKVQAAQDEAKIPFAELLRTHRKQLLQGMGTRWIEGLVFNAYAVLAVSYATSDVGVSKSVVLNGIAIGAAIGCVLTPVYGHLSDRFGRKRVYSAGVVAIVLYTFPSLALIRTGSTPLIWLSIALGLGVIYAAIYAPLAAMWSEMFDTRVRYTGIGSVYQFSGIYASGLTPLIGASLIGWLDGEPWLFATYMVVIGVFSLAVVSHMPETYRKEIMPTVSADGEQIDPEPVGEIALDDSPRAGLGT
ncbi:MHS family MFS transporter [Nocardioidaceae bacterium SCSIO 66511]|nr:MHS family MFS transporter [Nocardioidaceae bacterium SCSIO 66511]